MALYFRKALLNYKHAFSCYHKTLCGTINIKAYFLHDFDWTQIRHATQFSTIWRGSNTLQTSSVDVCNKNSLYILCIDNYKRRFSDIFENCKETLSSFFGNLWMFYELDFNGILINKKCQTKLFEKEELQIELRNLH